MAKVGRPTKYREEYAEQVYKLCLLGATDEDLADFFEVSVQTIHNWTDAHPEFLEARKRGKEAADANVADRLYQRATGYEHDAVKIFQHDGASYEHPYTKRYAPDTTAAIFWLKNRQPKRWRDRQEIHVSIDDASDDELLERARQQANRIAALTKGTPANAARNGSNRNGSHG